MNEQKFSAYDHFESSTMTKLFTFGYTLKLYSTNVDYFS